MNIIDVIIIVIIIALVVAAVVYLHKEKKRGRRCMGCSMSGCEACSCNKKKNK